MQGKKRRKASIAAAVFSNVRTVPFMRDKDPAVAIACSDLHFCHTAPIARSQESDWYAAMRRPVAELKALQKHLRGSVILYAGDIFDRWNAFPELINFLLEELPFGYAVPGQHDLYYHEPSTTHRTAYGTLVKAGKLKQLDPEGLVPEVSPSIRLYGFPWNVPIEPCPHDPSTFITTIAVCHLGIWTNKTGHPGAPKENHIGQVRKKLAGYDAAVFGDNHKGFISCLDPERPNTIINCGAFMRRKSDEADTRPMVGVIRASGSIEPYYLDTSEDRLLEKTDAIQSNASIAVGILEFVEELNKLNDQQLNFREALARYMDSHQTRPEVRAAVMESIQ